MAVKSLVRSGVDNFEKYSSLLAGNIGYDTYFEHITTTTLGSAVASVTFSDLDELAGTYQHLQLRIVAKQGSTGVGSMYIQLNNDTGSNYASHQLWAVSNSGTPGSSGGGSRSNMEILYLNRSTSNNVYTGAVIDILDPYETKNKTLRCFGGTMNDNGASYMGLFSGLYNSTSILSVLTLTPDSGNSFSANSRFSLFGLR